MNTNVVCIKSHIPEFTAVVTNRTANRMTQWINSLPTDAENAKTYQTYTKMGLKAYYNTEKRKVIVEEYYEGIKKRRAYCTIQLAYVSDLVMLHIDFERPEAIYFTESGYNFEDTFRYIATLNTILDTNF